MPDRPSQVVADRLIGGRYRLIRLLGRGGMAQVWEATDEVLARPVALKILHPHLAGDPDFLERFRREAIAAARIHSPHVVATYDAGTEPGAGAPGPYIVMELVRGRNLRQILSTGGALPLAQAIAIALQVADALAAAHAVGLVHRDIKPGNILVGNEPPFVVASPLVKVADFGVARMLDACGSDLTGTGLLVGTAAYLSPEQVDGRSPDGRSDVYSLGVVLYEMVGGRPPHVADTDLGTALLHLHAVPRGLRELRAGVPPALEAVVARALARDPAERFQSAAELRAALVAVDPGPDNALPLVEHEPTWPNGIPPVLPGDGATGPDPGPASLRRRRRRGRLAAVGATAVAAALVAGVLAAQSGHRGNRAAPSTTPTSRAPASSAGGSGVAIAKVALLDTAGDDSPGTVDLMIDGNPGTAWLSSWYNYPPFANLKPGIGVIVTLARSQRLQRLQVVSPTTGWAAQAYVAAAPSQTLGDWGAPVSTASAIQGSATFNLGSRTGAAVLLWITDPGTTLGHANRVGIQELLVS